jgi:uridylate kinase
MYRARGVRRRKEDGPEALAYAVAREERALPPAVALSVGGSVLSTGKDDEEYIGRLADLLRRRGREFPLVVTTGGGRTAREYIRLGRALGFTEVELDEIGIDVTRLHARLLAARIGPPTPATPPTSIAEAVREVRHVSPVVLGGTEPGHTTDGVAALLAVRLRAARFVNATREDGLFDHDPRSHPGAKRIDHLGFAEFRSIVHRGSSGEAGQEFLFDRLAADALARARIPISIVDGRDLDNLDSAILGRPFRGTLIGGLPDDPPR